MPQNRANGLSERHNKHVKRLHNNRRLNPRLGATRRCEELGSLSLLMSHLSLFFPPPRLFFFLCLHSFGARWTENKTPLVYERVMLNHTGKVCSVVLCIGCCVLYCVNDIMSGDDSLHSCLLCWLFSPWLSWHVCWFWFLITWFFFFYYFHVAIHSCRRSVGCHLTQLRTRAHVEASKKLAHYLPPSEQISLKWIAR